MLAPMETTSRHRLAPPLRERLRHGIPLAAHTTLQLGGPASQLLTIDEDHHLAEALRWARREDLPVQLLGGGSNLVVADTGFPGLVIRLAQRGLRFERDEERVLVAARAGESWDELVAACVAENLAGVECLAGIPGSAGATPIQNVGAYGQEVADTLQSVRVLDLVSLVERTLSPAQCAFGYRTSLFRRRPSRFAVLEVTFSLRPGGAPTVRYPELSRKVEVATSGATPGLATVREAVLELRRAKSMVLDPEDPNRRSVGSFFVNPVVPADAAERVVERAVALGVAETPGEVPRYPAPDGVKLSAAWLIERAGFPRGTRRGTVGTSTRHSLALVHHGEGTTGELLALAREIRDGVEERFGITLHPEPVFVGFESPDPL